MLCKNLLEVQHEACKAGVVEIENVLLVLDKYGCMESGFHIFPAQVYLKMTLARSRKRTR